MIADTALCSFEPIKVRVQRGYAKGLFDGFPRLYRAEGLTGLYKGLLPLWGRNLPFAMLMFSTFEHSVDFLYGNVIHKPRTECSKGVQLGVTCVAGYMSGVAGTIITNPADYMITIINNRKGISYVQAAKSIGVVGLFTRSLPLRVKLVGPLVTAQWFCYDTIKTDERRFRALDRWPRHQMTGFVTAKFPTVLIYVVVLESKKAHVFSRSTHFHL